MDFGWQELGQTAGAAIAVFLATWVGLVRPLKRQAASGQDIEAIREDYRKAQKEAGRLREELVRVATQLEGLQAGQVKLEKLTEKIGEKLSKTVTEEEFAAYSQAMNQNMQSLVEKLGNATGAIEGWYRSQGGGR